MFVACSGPPAGDGPAPDSGDPSSTSAETGDSGDPRDTAAPPISASCAPTDNVLRMSCTVEVDPPQPVRIRFAPEDGPARAERVHTSALAAAEHEIPLFLMTAETEYTFTAEAVDDPELAVSGTFTTGEVPELVQSALAVTGTSSVRYVGTHLPCDGLAIGVVYDTATGGLAWYGQLDDNGNFGFLNMVRFTDDHTVLGETGGKIVEMDLTGEVLLELRLGDDYAEALHHDLYKRGGYVYAVFEDPGQEPGQPNLDGFLVFDVAAGAQVAEWRARDALTIPTDADGDWMHTNSIFADAAGDVYLSSFTQSSILKIAGDWTAPDFGELRWSLAGGSPAGFGQDFVVDWSAVGADGFANQHDLTRLDDGRIVMLDNAHGRALVLSVDEATSTARVDAEYAASWPGCGPQGTAAMTSTGDVLVSCNDGHLLEYDADGDLKWEALTECGGGSVSAARWYPLEGW